MQLALPAHAADIVGINVENDTAVITLTLPNVSPHKVFIVTNPERLVVDVPAVAKRPEVKIPDNYKGKLVRDVRFGQFSPEKYRFVFDLTLPVEVVKVSSNSKNTQMTVAIKAAGNAAAASEPVAKPEEKKPDEASKEKPAESKAADKVESKIEKAAPVKEGTIKAEPVEDIGKKETTKGAKEKTKATTKEEPADKTKSEDKQAISKIAEEPKSKKSNEKPLIVIDPGHGGVDPGTTGPNGINEKDLVLEYGKALRQRLLKSGKYRVELTRGTDNFIMLRQRVKIARDKKAALFISLHADSAPEAGARGLSVYTLSEKSSDEEAAALAARENKADVLAGIDLSEERQDVADILISLAQRDTSNRSSQLADLIVYSLDGKVRLLSNSHRFAGFAVLKAPDIPSVLIELGFLSHMQEEKQLRSAAYRQMVVSGIADGVESYFAQNGQAEE
jgi:N-acetylmuramoyl-L-alanine amidase